MKIQFNVWLLVYILFGYYNYSYSSVTDFQNTLDPVVVVARRVESDLSSIAGNVQILDKSDISSLPAKNLSEVLSYIPGIDVFFSGYFGQSASVSIQGSQARHVLVVVDGIPFNQQLSGQANLNHVPLGSIERIEIVKASSSGVWGSGLGGIIHIVTKSGQDQKGLKGSVQASLSEFSSFQKTVNVSGQVDQTSLFFSAETLNAQGNRQHSKSEDDKIFLKVQHELTDQVGVLGSFGYNDADIVYGPTAANRNNVQPYTSMYGQFGLKFVSDEFGWKGKFQFHHQDLRLDLQDSSTKEIIFVTDNENFYKGFNFVSYLSFLQKKDFSFGVDIETHQIKSNNYLDGAESIQMQGYYANYTLNKNQWTWSTGVRFDDNDRFGRQVSPSFGVEYDFYDSNESSLYFKASRNFNAPPLLWILNDDPSLFIGPNPDLKAEKSQTYEAGFQTNLNAFLKFDVSTYYSVVKDAIGVVFSNGLFIQDNFNEFRRQGVEMALNYDVNHILNIYASGAFNDIENQENGSTVQNVGVRHQYQIGSKFSFDNDLFLHLIGNYTDSNSSLDRQANDDNFIFDLKIKKKFKIKKEYDAEIFCSVYNLFDVEYWSNISFPLYRRYLELGFGVKF